jgi:hypothetical protein
LKIKCLIFPISPSPVIIGKRENTKKLAYFPLVAYNIARNVKVMKTNVFKVPTQEEIVGGSITGI